MEDIDLLLNDFYGKYNNEVLTDEKRSKIKSTYGSDYNTLLKDLYGKYAKEDISEEKIGKIYDRYKLSAPPQKEEGVISESELFPNQKTESPEQKKENYPTRQKIEEENTLKKETTLTSREKEHQLLDKTQGSYSELFSQFSEQTQVSNKEKEEISLEIENDLGKKGVWNTIKDGAKKWWNNAIGEEGLQVSTDPLNESKEKARKELEKNGIEINEANVLEKAKELEFKKREESLVKSKKNAFMKDLSETDKNELTAYQSLQASSFSKETKSLLFEQESLRNNLSKKADEIKNLNAVLAQKKENGEPIDEEFEANYNQKAQEYNEQFIRTQEQYNQFLDKQEDLGTAKDNLDLFKRDYGYFSNFSANISTSALNIASGFLKLPEYGRQIKSKFLPDTLNALDAIISEKASKDGDTLKQTAEEIQGNVIRPMSVDDINGIGDLASWTLNNAIAQQIPILAMVSTGVGGVVGLSASSIGQKYGEMVDEEKNNPLLPKYTDTQKLAVPFFSGMAEGVGYAVDAMIFKGAMRTFNAATKPERQLFAKAWYEKGFDIVKETGTEVSKAAMKEIPEEVSVEFFQNALDKYALGKEVNLSDGLKDAAAASLVFALLPGGSVVTREMLKPYTQDAQFDQLVKEVTFLEGELGNGEKVFSDKIRTQLQKNLGKKKAKLEKIVVGISKDMKSMSKETYDRITSIENQKSEIRNDANELKADDTLDKNVKKMLLKDFENDYKALNEEQKTLNSKQNKFDSLTKERQQYLKDQASKTLVEEKQQKGETEFKITDKEITDKAVELAETESNPALNETEKTTKEETKSKVETTTPSTETKQESVEPAKTLDAFKADLDGITLEDESEVDNSETKTQSNKETQSQQEVDAKNESVSEVESNKNEDDNSWFDTFMETVKNEPELSEQEIIDQRREEDFKKRNYDPKWAKTYKEGKDKTVKKFKEAKTEKEKWQSKKYKSAGNKTVEVGTDNDFDNKNIKIDQINENRRKKAIRNADADMKESLDILKELGLTESEISEITNETQTQGDITTDKDVQSGNAINENKGKGNQVQSAINDRTNSYPIEIKEGKSNYTITKNNGIIETINSNGKKPSKPTERKRLRKHAENIDLTIGEKYTPPKGVNPQEITDIDERVANESNNPAEIAEIALRTKTEDFINENSDSEAIFILEQLYGNVKRGKKGDIGNDGSFINQSDANNITNGLARTYLKKDGYGLDQHARDLSEEMGKEISMDYLVDLMNQYPNGINDVKKEARTTSNTAKNRFTELTGLPSSDWYLQKAVEQSIKKEKLNEELRNNHLQFLTNEELLSLEQNNLDYEKTINERTESKSTTSNTSQSETKPRVREETDSANERKAKPTKERRKQIANAKIDDIANALKGIDNIFGVKIKIDNIDGINKNGIDIIGVIADIAKQAVAAGIEIDVAIQKTIEHLKKSLDFDVNPEDVKARIEKSEEKTTQKPEPKKSESKKKKKSANPQAFSTRAFKSENLNQETKNKLEKLGLDYAVESQITAENDGKKAIAEFGLLEAYNLAKNYQIRGGAKIYIQAQMFDALNQQIYDAKQKGDTVLAEELIDELSVIMKAFADEKTLIGQEISMLYRIYKTSNMKYDLEFAKQQWDKKFEQKMSPEIEARLKRQAEKIKNRDKTIKELEEKIGTLEEQTAVNDIQSAVDRRKRINSKKKYTLSTEEQKRKKQLRNKFFGTLNDVSRIATLLADPEFREYLALVFKSAKGDLQNFAVKVRNEIGVKSKKVSKQLFEEANKEFNKSINKKIAAANEDSNGIKIPSDLIYDLVESGVDNITDLTNAVHDVLKEQYANLTHREVRDAITGYGKQVSETQDDIKKKISSLKTDGKQFSALDDLAENKRPKRSGRKPRKLTAEQRNRIKKIRELLKTLPFDDTADKESFYKTALEGYKTRVQNRIKDLNEAINKGEGIINERRNLPLDQEAKSLIEQRDKLQKEYDETFEKPYKSDETLINEIVARKEKQLKDLQVKVEEIKLTKKEPEKPKKREVSDPEIDRLTQEIEAKREELSDVLDEVGIAEQKRLARAKKYVERSITELQRRIKERDFAPRKPKKVRYDKELIELKRQQILDKAKYEIEFEKQELREMGASERLLDATFKLFGTFKGLKATFDLSAMLRQGAFLGVGNPKEFSKATVDMHKFVASSKEYKTWMAEIESSPDYVYMMEDGLSITDTSGDVLRSEERFVGNLISKIPVIGKITDASERAYGGFLNSLRISSYRKLSKQHESLGYTREKNPEVFKNIAYYVNGATGRGKLSPDKNIAKALNIAFFSPRMITGMYSVTKTLVNPNTTKTLRKEALKSLGAFVGYQYLSKLVLLEAYKLLVMPFSGEDEEDIATDYRAVSTDFNKLRIGETRYDVSAGYGIAVRTLARIMLQEKAKSSEYDAEEFDGFFNSVGNESQSFLWNKTSPLFRQILNYHTNEHPSDIRKDIDDATAYDYFEALFVPLTLQELMSSINNDTPKSKVAFDTLLTIYGVGVQTYD